MSDKPYLGSQDQGDTASEFNARDFHIRQVIEQSVRLGQPVKIVRAPYDKDGNDIPPGTPGPIGYVDVQPLVNQIDGYGNATPHGTVYRISYHRAQGGNGAIISDPVVGDIGHAVVADRDTTSVRANDAAANPGSRRKFDFADATYFGSQQAGSPRQWLAFLAAGFNLTDSYGNTIIGTADGVRINGCLINQSGDVITPHGVNVDTHVHTGVVPGGGDTGPPDV